MINKVSRLSLSLLSTPKGGAHWCKSLFRNDFRKEVRGGLTGGVSRG